MCNPDLNSLQKVIDYFAKISETAEEAWQKASQYAIDRAFRHGGWVAHPTEAFRQAVYAKFAEVHNPIGAST